MNEEELKKNIRILEECDYVIYDTMGLNNDQIVLLTDILDCSEEFLNEMNIPEYWTPLREMIGNKINELEARLEGFQKGKLEERKRILKEIDKTITFVDVRRASSLIGLEIIKCLKQLQKEIGEEKGK
jgi:hypothetical protein